MLFSRYSWNVLLVVFVSMFDNRLLWWLEHINLPLVLLGIAGYRSDGGSLGSLFVVNLLINPCRVIAWLLHPCGVFANKASCVGDIQYFHVLSIVACHGPSALRSFPDSSQIVLVRASVHNFHAAELGRSWCGHV
jgi:hypothetical protein